ncbi:unnamed protein product [Urochloa humidicola]
MAGATQGLAAAGRGSIGGRRIQPEAQKERGRARRGTPARQKRRGGGERRGRAAASRPSSLLAPANGGARGGVWSPTVSARRVRPAWGLAAGSSTPTACPWPASIRRPNPPPPLHQFQIAATHGAPRSSATSPTSPQRAPATTRPPLSNLVAAAGAVATAGGAARRWLLPARPQISWSRRLLDPVAPFDSDGGGLRRRAPFLPHSGGLLDAATAISLSSPLLSGVDCGGGPALPLPLLWVVRDGARTNWLRGPCATSARPGTPVRLLK